MSRLDAYSTPRADVAALLPATAGSVLDLGCSSGAFGESIRTGRRVVGLDAAGDTVAAARDRLDAAHHVDLADPAWPAVLAGERFDAIVAADVLEHLPDPDQVLTTAIDAALAPDGCIIVSLPNIRHVSALWQIGVAGSFARRDRGIFDDSHLRWFTWRDTLRLLGDHGLEVEDWSANLRLLDRPGGVVNDRVASILGPWRRRGPIREFLAYQFVVRARPAR